jgi:hypothetical protein
MKKLLFILLILPQIICASELSNEDLSKLKKGDLIKQVQWPKDLIWPKVTIYKLIKHSPKENIEIFKNFENHKTFIPDMLESKIIKTIPPNRTQIYFEMNMPWPINKSSHITENQLISENDNEFKIQWKLIKADLLKSTNGYLIFSKFEDKTLLTYETLIVPNSSFAGMFKNRVADDVEKSVLAITAHLEKSLRK